MRRRRKRGLGGLLLILLPVAQVSDLLNSSFMSTVFYSHSTILPFIIGRI